MLVKVLCSHSITTRRRLSSEGNVTFEDLMRGAANFDVRTVTIEGLTSVRYLLSATVRIVTVIAAIWSPGLSWSHNTLQLMRLDRYPVRAYQNASVAQSEGVAPLFCTAASSFAHARWGRPNFQQFFGAIPDEGLKIGSPLVGASAPTPVAGSRWHASNRHTMPGDRGFESISLQRRVSCEPFPRGAIAGIPDQPASRSDWLMRSFHRPF
jgi:hypothetical protein